MNSKSGLSLLFFTILGSSLGFTLVAQLFLNQVKAESHYQTVDVDRNIAESGFDKYAKVEKIVLCNIDKSSLYNNVSSEDWYKSLYFYTITSLHFYDIPYNFVYDGGTIYQGRQTSHWVDLQPLVVNNTQGIVLVGVTNLAGSLDSTLSSFISYLLDVYDISPSAVLVKDCKIEKTQIQDSFVSNFSLEESFVSISSFVGQLSVSDNFKRTYEGSVTTVSNEEYTDPDKNLSVKINIENTGDYAWYAVDDFYIVTTDLFLHDSQFFLTGVWPSRSHAKKIDQDIPPGETIPITFELRPGIMPGEYTEKFIIVDKNKLPIQGTEFSVSFITNNVDYTFVRVKENQWGFLNVRESPSSSAEIVTKVSPGEIFIVVEHVNSWYKIKIDETREGWVSGTYIEFL
ncbi:SH3 domain-containing protein [Candidatus Dojkabacteria bacterium]|nr:SH3 domain-containing protein [Candidatus Dojkabacteria bacterium]